MPSADEVIGKYVELRDRKAEIAKRQAEELRPLSEAMEGIENWLMHQMNTIGTDQLKGEHGTAFKSIATSVQMQDPVTFKKFVFAPALTAVHDYMLASGLELPPFLLSKVDEILQTMARWNVVDFRAGKKGIQEYQEQTNEAVPGIAINQVASVSIRRA